ncbi:hypothetical protein B7P43_G07034 [Cryptotermes secundus]|uniref:Pre-C2HC domain-containing protein n=1 Tax=Cryptotermes secundus TaxID=105785 RepID=A0A2J7RDP1_9NEOP|nr:hypothetical protein B7P43_G07034 [Cryptotermes secundus]
MIKRIQKIAEQEQCFTKSLANNIVKINCETPETYKEMIREFNEQGIYHHTYQLKEERAYRIVIRYLHHSTRIKNIKQELAELEHRVRNIINIYHKTTKEPLNLLFVYLEPTQNNKKIYEITGLQNRIVKIEPPHSDKTNIIQCTRCQQYGHTKTDCKKTRETPARCALCGGNHPAKYRGCEYFRKVTKEITKRNLFQTEETLRTAQWNASGLPNHQEDIKIFLNINSIDSLLISETHFTSRSYFSIPNYKLYHTNHPEDSPHGGTAVLIREKNRTSTGTPPKYWPTDENKVPDLLEFFVTNGISPNYTNETANLDLPSDHIPIIATISTSVILRKSKPRLHNSKTNWNLFREIIENNTELKIKLKEPTDVENERQMKLLYIFNAILRLDYWPRPLKIAQIIMILKPVIKPIWTYDKELWGCASKSNITIMQSAQSKILRTFTNAPGYVSNHTLHTDLKTPYVTEVIREKSTKYFNKLENHSNPLLQSLQQPHQNRRLKRIWPPDLRN